jgi:hypothetical protein
MIFVICTRRKQSKISILPLVLAVKQRDERWGVVVVVGVVGVVVGGGGGGYRVQGFFNCWDSPNIFFS